MRAWWWHHIDALRTTLGRLLRTPVATLFNVSVIGVALALPVGLYVAVINLEGLARSLGSDPQLSVFLALDAGPADVIDSLPGNPLPDAFVVLPRDTAPEVLDLMRDEMRRWPKVTHVQLDAEWARRLEAGLRAVLLAVSLLATLFAFALVAVTFNTIRLQILTRREEIEVSKLIGATDSFIRRPFLYYGALQGLAGGLAAWAIIWAGVTILNGALVDLSRLYAARIELRHLGVEDSASLLVFSAALGWFGSWLSVNRHLATIEPR